jgi:septal ring factor EnvC (AmiA/AmiB activator)
MIGKLSTCKTSQKLKENSVRVKIGVFVAFLTLGLLSCDSDKNPTYDQLKQQNAELEAEVQGMHEKIQQAKSDLDDLKTEISTLENTSCHEDDAMELQDKADDVDQALDDADNP